MSCPDWTSLVAHRYRGAGKEPAGWWEALAHLKGCQHCQQAALEADPTLLFVSRLPTEEVGDTAISARMVVARARRKGEGASPVPRIWLAAAAVLLLAFGVSQGVRRLGLPDGASEMVSTLVPAEETTPSTPPALVELPLVEGVSGSDTRIYQVATGELDFVVIVDAGLELQDGRLDL